MNYVFITNGNEELNRQLQEKLFELGASWCNRETEVIHTDAYEIWLSNKGLNKSDRYYHKHSDQETILLNPYDVISGKVIPPGLELKPRFWKDKYTVWFSLDNKETTQVDNDLLHSLNGWTVRHMEIHTAGKTCGHGDCTQAEAEAFLKADFDGKEFIARKVKITIDGKETFISRESAQALRKSLEI
jgi:hypothetical protein